MSTFSTNLQRQDRIAVKRDGEEVEVFNWANVRRFSTVRATNPVVSHDDTRIGAGDSTMKPDAVTHWVAEELDMEFGIDPEKHDIEVIDVTSDEVTVL